MHVNGGFDVSGGYVERYEPLMRRLRAETGLLLGLGLTGLAWSRRFSASCKCGESR